MKPARLLEIRGRYEMRLGWMANGSILLKVKKEATECEVLGPLACIPVLDMRDDGK